MPTEPTPATDIRADLHRGLSGRWRLRRSDGGTTEVDVLLTTPRGWADREESLGPGWSPLSLGPFIVALRSLPDA